ncbi:hypothetical protein R1flu_016145 [Riccia fluitans]|uniref:Uncharacterized protein n=1 Tax=Riccia fluitans TaxID=41844 RepID=A0ABD1YL05_9MARC
MMATVIEELRLLTLFDREAELMPESRPAWQQSMEFVRYPGPKQDDLHPIHFWYLEHYGILPYYLQIQSNAIPAKVFFSIVSTCRYVSLADKTKHLELRGLTGHRIHRLIVSPEVVWEAFGISREAAHDKEARATWPNQVALKFVEVEELGIRQYFQVLQDRNEHLIYRLQASKEPAIVPLQMIHDCLLCKAGSMCRYNLPAVSAFLRTMHYRAMN